jgi:hypothetical protein
LILCSVSFTWKVKVGKLYKEYKEGKNEKRRVAVMARN